MKRQFVIDNPLEAEEMRVTTQDVIYPFPIQNIQRNPMFLIFHDVISPKKIKNLIKEIEPFASPMIPHSELSPIDRYGCNIPLEGFESLYKTMAEVMIEANKMKFHSQLIGFFEELRFIKYTKGGFAELHTDYDSGSDKSKLSSILMLSKKKDYEGGEFTLLEHSVPELEQGDMIVFPAYLAHSVLPVTSGVRRVIGAWASGFDFI